MVHLSAIKAFNTIFRMILRVKFLLLAFGVALFAMGELQDNDTGSSVTPGSLRFVQAPATESRLQSTQAPKENKTTDGNDISNKIVTEMLRGTGACRERPLKAHNRARVFKSRGGGSTHRGRAWFGKNSNISVFHCNISKELVDGLTDKLHQLEIFQDIIVLYPKNRSSYADRLSTPHAGTELKKYHKSFLPKKDHRPVRMVRETLLRNDRIESDAKILQMSHIYLGRSLYPFFTEESRVIGGDHTLPPPVYTSATYSYDEEN